MSAAMTRLARQIRDLELEVRGRNKPQLAYSSIEDGAVTTYSQDGTLLAIIGQQFDGAGGVVATNGAPPPTPTPPAVVGALGGLRVSWDGLWVDAIQPPSDFSRIEVHVSETDAFTPSAATLKGTIETPRGTTVPVALPLEYDPQYVRLVAVNTSGIFGAASAEIIGTPKKVEAADIEANAITANLIDVGTLNGFTITGVIIEGGEVNGTTITGGTFRTAASGERVELNAGSHTGRIQFFSGSGGEASPGLIESDAFLVIGGLGGGSTSYRGVLRLNAPLVTGGFSTPAGIEIYDSNGSTFGNTGININGGDGGVDVVAGATIVLEADSGGVTVGAVNAGLNFFANASSQPLLRPADLTRNSGLVFGDSRLNVRNRADSAYADIAASGFPVNSSRQVKEGVQDLDELQALMAIKGAPAYRWNYIADAQKKVHVGPMAEDLPQLLVRADDDGTLSVDIRDQLGVLWGAVRKLAAHVNTIKPIA